MTNYLTIALLLVCFYDAILVLLIPSSATFFLAEDGAAGRMIATLAALSIGLVVAYVYGLKRLPNIWAAAFLVFMAFSSFHSPNLSFESTFIPKDSAIFNYKPMFEILVYFFMFLGIQSIPMDQEGRYKLGNSIAWVGILYAGYILLQSIGIDQVYKMVNYPWWQMSKNPLNGGFISQPVFAAAVLSLCLPFVLRYKPGFILLLLPALLATGNRSCLVALAFMGIFLITRNKRLTFMLITMYVFLIAIAVLIFHLYPGFNFHFNPHGRLQEWGDIIKDFAHPKFPGINKAYILTGVGPGAFSIVYPFYNHSGFYQAHNEYLEIFYCLSFVGLFLFARMHWHLMSFSKNTTYTAALIGISVFALTNPIWHVPQIQFLTVLLAGLAYNQPKELA